MSSDQVFPEIPFVLDNFVADVAIDSLRLNVNIDDVLLEVEAVRECFPAVVAESGLHAAPPLAGVGHGTTATIGTIGARAQEAASTLPHLNPAHAERVLGEVAVKVERT